MLLSICIPTLNRARFIGETLDSILPQLREDMEVVIVDGGSTDETADVVAQRAAACPRIRYDSRSSGAGGTTKPSNTGFDRDCDRSIQLAKGAYCWILPDDDVIAPHAISVVAARLEAGTALVVVNAEVRSMDLQQVLRPRFMRIEQDVTIRQGQADRLLTLAGAYLSYVGGVVVRRNWWLARDRERHFGSGFVHVATLFQDHEDLDAVLIAEPLVRLRYGNALWVDRALEIGLVQWPALIWSLDLPDCAKSAVISREPWRRPLTLAFYRARGWYNWKEYRRLASLPQASRLSRLAALLVVLVPAWSLNMAGLAATLLVAGRRSTWWADLWGSPHNLLVRARSQGPGVHAQQGMNLR